MSGAATAQPTAAPGGEDEQIDARSWYLVAVLTMAYTASFIDRQVLNLLVEPIKADFGLSDTKLSLLQGLAFTLSYVLMSPVFGRWTDVGNRRNILMFGVVLWSMGTACCGLARSFWQLFAARFAVGGAEACLTPACWSIISDSFPPRRIPRAFSIYMMGPYLGGGLALIFGGILLDRVGTWDLTAVPLLAAMEPWQLVFVLVGTPGIVVALLLCFVREPARHGLAPGDKIEQTDMAAVRRGFVERRTFYATFYTGMSLVVIALYGFPAWMPAVMMRQFGATPAQVGVDYGILVLVCGSVGVLTGPWLAARLAARGRRDALLMVPFACALLLVPTAGALFFVTSYTGALAVGAVAALLYSIPQALASSALQLATPNRMRGMASAIYVFAVSVSGLALAPTIIALITDHVLMDEARVGTSLAITVIGSCGIGALCLWRCMAAYRRIVA